MKLFVIVIAVVLSIVISQQLFTMNRPNVSQSTSQVQFAIRDGDYSGSQR